MLRPVPTRCPICASPEIEISRLDCPRCASGIDGRFRLPRLAQLTPEQLHFVEIFLLNEGKINRVEQEMGLSYTAVRGRLQEIVEALGGQVDGEEVNPAPPARPTPFPDAAAREQILARLSAGEITAAEAAALLKS